MKLLLISKSLMYISVGTSGKKMTNKILLINLLTKDTETGFSFLNVAWWTNTGMRGSQMKANTVRP